MTDFLETPQGRRIAYHKTEGQGPTVVFLGGFASDMEGTKAVHLEAWARAQGRAFLRFDYSGHGESSGRFTDGCIGDWATDAAEVIGATTSGPLVLVGSSMGGWISLLTTKRMGDRIAGLVGIAAAPDFTEDGYWASFDEAQRLAIEMVGHVEVPSDYGDPFVITRRLIEDGRSQLVLRDPLPLPFPVRFLQGTEDEAVSRATALRLLDHVTGDDVRLTLVKGADHRFSTPECLALIESALAEVLP
ncbi:alpha/beta fold hydrolase [Mesobacterium pallidum]|uniref:alpha/beta fold hydrolase n=1 Tax=Mesobacterium pallidum TaxID=2872037 RepID=UPI001EE20BF9|nr:alpha/beta hydrolase [Mesobacterium pallidum]